MSAGLLRSRMQSLIAMMMSPRVLGQVAARLNLKATPADLERMLGVYQVAPEVLRINATAPSPELATNLANGLAATFVQFYGDVSTNAIAESTKLLREQEMAARKEVERYKVAVTRFKARQGISSLSNELGGIFNRLTSIRQVREAKSARLEEVRAQLSQVDAQLANAPETLRVVESSNDSLAAQQLRAEIAVLERDLALERGVRTDLHPRVRDLQAKLDSVKARLRREEETVRSQVRYLANPNVARLQQQQRELRTERDGLMASITYLKSSIAALQKEMVHYSGADLQLVTLMQRYTMAEQRYTGVLSRLRQAETNVDAMRRSSAIAIVDTSGPLNPPVDISLGKAKKLTLTAFVLSLVMSIFLLAAWDFLDRRVRTTDDAEAMVELPVAGIIPRALPRAATTPYPRLAALMPASPEGAAYRFLSLHLLLSREENQVRVLMMATPKPGQGATTTISNLAVTLAQGNRRVILVDADMRRPSLHGIFETNNDVGLSNVLAEGIPVEQALQPTTVRNLALLPGGPLIDNPWELLRSQGMGDLVQRLRHMADFVLIDTPSAAAFADAFNVAPLVDGVFMVVRSRHQPTGIEMKIKRMFEAAGVKVFGAILNDVPLNNVDSCRYHSQYYSSERGARRALPPALPAGKS
jgi:capsular exopolysaccharide synthesis family protein